jgi:hypothetical protein
MQTKQVNPIIEDSLKKIRYQLVKIRKAAKQDTWTREERCAMQKSFDELENQVSLLRYRCGMA